MCGKGVGPGLRVRPPPVAANAVARTAAASPKAIRGPVSRLGRTCARGGDLGDLAALGPLPAHFPAAVLARLPQVPSHARAVLPKARTAQVPASSWDYRLATSIPRAQRGREVGVSMKGKYASDGVRA